MDRYVDTKKMAAILSISWVLNLRWGLAFADEADINCLSKIRKKIINFTANKTVTIQSGLVKGHYVSRTIIDLYDPIYKSVCNFCSNCSPEEEFLNITDSIF